VVWVLAICISIPPVLGWRNSSAIAKNLEKSSINQTTPKYCEVSLLQFYFIFVQFEMSELNVHSKLAAKLAPASDLRKNWAKGQSVMVVIAFTSQSVGMSSVPLSNQTNCIRAYVPDVQP